MNFVRTSEVRSFVRPNSLVIQKCKWKSDGTRKRIKTEAGTVSFDQRDLLVFQKITFLDQRSSVLELMMRKRKVKVLELDKWLK